MDDTPLASRHCQTRTGMEHKLPAADTDILLPQLSGWSLDMDGKSLVKDFRFTDFHHTLGFINAVAFIANQENHHPDIEAGYNHCRLRWWSHDVGGLSLNDFICAARVDALLA